MLAHHDVTEMSLPVRPLDGGDSFTNRLLHLSMRHATSKDGALPMCQCVASSCVLQAVRCVVCGAACHSPM